jgi:hypothetical protein
MRTIAATLMVSFVLMGCGDGDSDPTERTEQPSTTGRPAKTFSAELPSDQPATEDLNPDLANEEQSPTGNESVPAPDTTPEQVKAPPG